MPEEFGSSEAGKKGGEARAKSLTKEQRSIQARGAAIARWAKEGKEMLPKATHEGVIRLGDDKIEISCFVLENGDRMVSTRGMMKGLGRTWRGRKYTGTEMPVFLEARNLKPFIHPDLLMGPIVREFITPQGLLAEGMKADFVNLVCETYLRARDAKKLTASQAPVAFQADILMRGFARVGLIALIDEATGFQDDRDRRALALILEKFIAKELRPYVQTFPLDYYKELCRLRNVPFSPDMKMPRYFGHLTNNAVYSRLAPGVLRELRNRNPSANGRRKHKHFQHLTEGIGHPKLLQHLGSIVTLMKISDTWEAFEAIADKLHPPQKELPLFDKMDGE